MKFKSAIVATLFCGSLTFGQMPPHGPGGPRGEFGFRGGKVVAGAPYSATVTDTSVKTLPDGNTIQHTTSGTIARDDQGRTFVSQTVSGMFGQTGKKTMTFISDPVAGYVYTLNADTKTAMRRALHTREGAGKGTHTPESRPADPNVVSEDKGLQVVNGVNAQGKVMTRTIPAGTMGNEKAIVSKTETWYSPDLKVVVASTRVDPREGTNTYALTNIMRSEPAATLFQVPSDYTVKDAPSFGRQH